MVNKSQGEQTAGQSRGPDEQFGSETWSPWLVRELDVASGFPELAASGLDGMRAQGAWILIRAFDEPLGALWMPFERASITAAAIRDALPSNVATQIRIRLEDAGITWTGRVPLEGCTPRRRPTFLASRDVLLQEGPEVTAVVCTRNRPDEATRDVARLSTGPYAVSYVFEPEPGLSNARNRSVKETKSEIIAWIDDDETADPHWVCELVRGFAETPAAGSVCGVMVPAELETPAQVWFEEYGGHSKGRGFRPAVFSPATAHSQSPLLPLPPFGTGGNMAMRRSALECIGRFDPALGAGTATMGAEDTRALTDLLLAGGTVRYQPSALTHHFHRREYAAFERQMYGYGVGLTAYYMSLVLDRPSLLVPLAKLAPRALRDLRDPNGIRLGEIGPNFPAAVLRVHRRGLLIGPAVYVGARYRARRRSRSSRRRSSYQFG
jgi:GT2 family glycosyltransferase